MKAVLSRGYYCLNDNVLTHVLIPTQCFLPTNMQSCTGQKSHTMIEQLVFSCPKEPLNLLGVDAARKLDDVFVSIL